MRGTFRARIRRSMLELLDNIDLSEGTVEHLHHERNHQDKGNVRLLPAVSQDTECKGPLECRERRGLLAYSVCEAA